MSEDQRTADAARAPLWTLLNLSGRPRLPMILQSETAECGLACLAMVLSFHGHRVDLGSLRRRFAVSPKGATMRTILQMAQRLGMTGRGLRLPVQHLRNLRTPCILHWDGDHFVVLKAVRGQRVHIHDPAAGARVCDMAEAAARFTGAALELIPTSAFERRDERRRLRLSALCGRVAGMRRALGQALLLSAVMQVFVLAGPFYMQLAVDEAVVKGDGGLLTALAVGFGLLTLIHLGAEWLRAQVLLFLGNALSFQMMANLFHHLLRLPLPWFERRHTGDLVSRFGSTQPIREMISEGLVAAVVDGAMAAMTLAMAFLYSPILGLVVLAALGAYVLLRLAAFQILRRRQEELIHATALEQSAFIETVRAIQSIRLFSHEADREALWQNRFADVVNRGARTGRLQIGFKAANDLIYGLENVLVVYLGARLALDGSLTIGMLFAFMSYKQQFLDKATRLLETAIQFRMLDLHLDRIADIALTVPEEAEAGAPTLVERPLRGRIDLDRVTFRYSESGPAVIGGVDLTVMPGEFVAITGPSGGGKTTLLKIMLGLYAPSSGEVRVDGVPLAHFGTAAFRRQVGVVMQDDTLLAGSLADNISFFDPRLDVDWMRECARMAGIEDEIMHMPMNYNTPVGELGGGLSGGQRQRLLLARALYRRPRLLFMDEGSSHLDVAKEREVNHALARLDITRIIVAHRPETIQAADRVLELANGTLAERRLAAACAG